MKKIYLWMAGLGFMLWGGGALWAAPPAVEMAPAPPVLLSKGEGFGARFPELRQFKEKYQPRLLEIRKSVRGYRREMAQELQRPQPDRQKVRRLVGTMLDLKREQQLLLVDQMFEMLEALPPERRQEFMRPIIDHCTR